MRDKRAEGIARLMVSVRETYDEELDEAMLFSWHSMVMEGNNRVNKGQWRSSEDPMRVVSRAE